MNFKRVGVFVHQGAELYGSDYIFREVIRALHDEWNIHVVLDQDGPLVGELCGLCQSVTVYRLGVLRRSKLRPLRLIWMTFEGLFASFRLAILARHCKADLIYANTLGVWSPLLAARLVGAPSIQHLHEIIERPRFLARIMYGMTGRLARRIICVSEAVVDCVKTFYPGSTNKYVLIRNGLPDIDREMHVYGKIRSEFDVPKSRILVAMVGRLHFWKGQDVLLKAVWLLSQRDIRIDVILFGDVFKGYEAFSAKLHSLATGYGIVDRVHFAGFRHDVTDLLIDSDIVTVPSTLPDPFPTVALEALRAAVPLILSSSSGAAEIVVDGESAILCTPNNAEDLAEKLAVLVTSPKLREKLSAGGRDVFERMLVMSEFQRNIRSAVDDLVGKSRT